MIRKSLASILVLLLLTAPSGFSQMQALTLLLNPTLNQIHSPKDLSKFMRKNFKFVEDAANFGKVDYWQSPEEMLSLKKGDCEDFALFADAALKELGFESHVVSIYGKNQFAHTVTVFKQDGKYRAFNDGKLYKYDTDKIEDVLSKIHSEWIWAAFTERKNDRGWIGGIFYNPDFQPRKNLI